MSRLSHLQAVREPLVELETRRRRNDEQLKSKKDVADYFGGVHVRTVERWVQKGMPVAERTWAGHPLFRISDCLEWHRSFNK